MKDLSLIFILFFLSYNISYTQEKPVVKDRVKEYEIIPDDVFVVVEEMPRFPGCEEIKENYKRKQCAEKKFLTYLYENIEYSTEIINQGISCNVVVQFVVWNDGTIGRIRLVRDGDEGCGAAAIRVIEELNEKEIKFIPGKQRGVPVNVRLNQPMRFSPIVKKEKKSN